MLHTVPAQIIKIIKGSYGATDARLNFHFIRSCRSQKCRKQTRKPSLLLLVISLKLALFSVTTERLPHGTNTPKHTHNLRCLLSQSEYAYINWQRSCRCFSGDDRTFSSYSLLFFCFFFFFKSEQYTN